MKAVFEKETAHRLVDELPSTATWDDLMRSIYVRQAIDKGLDDRANGRVKEVREIRTLYKLPT